MSRVVCGTRTCGFCGSSGVNREHLWPEWLADVIVTSRGPRAFDAEIERGGETHRFRNPALEIKVRMPCKACNEGWMSRLENDVKPFMTGMVDEGETTILNEVRQRSLVRWIVKTAMVYEFAALPTVAKCFTADERRAFKDECALPSNLWIWLARYDGPHPAHGYQRRAPTSDTLPPRIYSLTFTANFLAMQVFAFRDSAGDLARVARATTSRRLLQRYPPPDGAASSLAWPPAVTIDDEGLIVLDD